MKVIVQSGDTPSQISQKYLGDASRWQEFYQGDPTKMQIGTTLNIPDQLPPTPPQLAQPQTPSLPEPIPEASPSALPVAEKLFTPETPEATLSALPIETMKEPELQKAAETAGIFSDKATPTAHFGQRGSAWTHSGGMHRGTDFAAPEGTIASLPDTGKWEVIEVGKGYNQGWGNSVVVKNEKTGETLRYSHLHTPVVEKGEIINAGTPIGLVGHSGNSVGRTGDHLDIEYTNSKGQLADPMKSSYGQYFK